MGEDLEKLKQRLPLLVTIARIHGILPEIPGRVVSLNLRLYSQSIKPPEGISFLAASPSGVTKTTAAYYITCVPSADLCQYSRNLGKAQRIELFQANDILRLWRTFCVNYEARTSTDPSRQMAKRRLKNYKLKHSLTSTMSIVVS